MTMLTRDNVQVAIQRLAAEDQRSPLLAELASLNESDFAPDGCVIVNNIDHPGLWFRGILGAPIVFGNEDDS